MSRYAGSAPRPLSKIAIIDQETIDIIAGQIPASTVDISGKVDKVTGKSLVADTEIAKIHLSGSDNQDLSGLVGTTDYRLSDARTPVTHTHDYEPANSNIQTHVLSSHAPATAQKNSDITDSEIKAKYITPVYNSVYRTILDSTGSHIAAKVAGTYGIPQGNPLAVTGTGTLYALNTIYIDSADYPTIDSKVTKLRVRCIIACNDVAPFTGTFKIGLHPVTRPGTSGGAGLCIYTIGAVVTGSQVTGTNLAADSINNLVGADFDLPANGFYVLAVVTSGTMATSAHVHISASLQIRNV